MPFTNVRGVRIHYEDAGSGPPLVIAHGLFGSLDAARADGACVSDWAASGVRAIAYDARGHGRSQHTTRASDYRWPALAADLLGLLDALGLERVSVYGTSMGAGTALSLALAHPERVERLVLRSPPPFGADLRAARPRMGVLALLLRCLGARRTASLLAALGGDERLTALLGSQRPAAVVPAIRALIFGDALALERCHEIAAPALVLAHPSDALHPLRSGELLQRSLGSATLLVAPSAAYFRERAAALRGIVSGFVKHEPLTAATLAPELETRTAHRAGSRSPAQRA